MYVCLSMLELSTEIYLKNLHINKPFYFVYIFYRVLFRILRISVFQYRKTTLVSSKQ